MNWITALGPAALLCMSTAGLAQSPTSQRFAVEGAGRLDCSTYIQARKDKGSGEFQRMIGFVEGYLSAANRYESDTFDLTPWHNAMAFDMIIEAHCKSKPGDTLVSVVQRMVPGLRPLRVASFSPLLEVGDSSNKTFIYEALLKRSQAVLRNTGFYQGEIDGKFNEQTRNAVANFQKAKGLTPTGIPDPATLWMLLNP